jgi:hypothetical protein
MSSRERGRLIGPVSELHPEPADDRQHKQDNAAGHIQTGSAEQIAEETGEGTHRPDSTRKIDIQPAPKKAGFSME